ncbi:MAG: sugar ABC transporter ATP-binding protein [Treponema sp.]|jgi:ribose transport system ATP-binding protein|nr:sugar ABC transporter ATP-binding protein [Treponema sp.]
MEHTPPLLEITGLTKQFPGVLALNNVDIKIDQGEIHILLGENGAGKSTLIKCIVGVEHPDRGELLWNGKPARTGSIREALDLGIAVIYQELSNIPCLSVMENMFVGSEIKNRGLIDWKSQRREALQYLERVGCHVDPDMLCEKLGMGQKQMVEIAKALQRNARLIIMDEPTASLSRSEIDRLLKLMMDLKTQGISILFITHKLDEAQKVGDVVTVLKDGKKVGETLPIGNVTEDMIIHMMVGRTLEEKYPKSKAVIGKEMLRAEHLSGRGFDDISFSVRAGEIMGVFGLVGAGRTETMRALFGADPLSCGRVFLGGRELRIKSPADAIREGIVLVTENRKEEGLVLIHDVVENATLPTLGGLLGLPGILNQKSRFNRTIEFGEKVNLRPLHVRKAAMNFSGGNQQKIVIEKWVMADAQVYIFDEPTKGVDIGAKTEIYGIMNSLAESGAAIIMISSEMQEILGMSDTVLVMYEGRQTGYQDEHQELTHEKLMVLGTGGTLDG